MLAPRTQRQTPKSRTHFPQDTQRMLEQLHIRVIPRGSSLRDTSPKEPGAVVLHATNRVLARTISSQPGAFRGVRRPAKPYQGGAHHLGGGFRHPKLSLQPESFRARAGSLSYSVKLGHGAGRTWISLFRELAWESLPYLSLTSATTATHLRRSPRHHVHHTERTRAEPQSS